MSTPRCERDDLIRRVLLALRLTERAVRASYPDEAPWADRWAVDARSEVGPLLPAEVVGAAALLLRSVAAPADHDHRVAAAADRLALLVAPLARAEHVRAAICLEPARALEHASAHVLLTDAGYPDAAFDRLLARSTDAAPAVERLPTRELEQQWLNGIRTDGEVTDDHIVARSVLGAPMDALAATAQDHNSFSHAVLYASDVGRRPTRLPRPQAEICADADAALAAALDADDTRRCAELLWTWPMLELPWTPTATFAFTLVAAHFDAHGFLPGPAYDGAQLDRLPAEAHEEYMVRSSFHATLAMGVLCASALGRARRPPPAVAPTDDRRCACAIYALLEEQPRPWLRAVAALEHDQQDSLGDLLVVVALRRARSRADLTLVREVLAVALRHGTVDAPAPRQAVELLRRAAAALGAPGSVNEEARVAV